MASKTTKPAVAEGFDEGFDDFLAEFNREFSNDPLRALSDQTAAAVDVVSTGVISLDVALGTGGLPYGRIVEAYGPTGGGKSTLSLSLAAQVTKAGKRVAFIDVEQAFSRELAQKMGVNMDLFFVVQPSYGEQVIAMVERMLEKGMFALIVVDSIAAMIPKVLLDGDLEGSQQMGRHANLMSTFMRRVNPAVSKSNTCLFLINQVRVNLAAYGAPEAPTGGKAPGFYSSVRIEVRTSAGRQIKKGTEVIGTTVQAKVTKNRFAAPFKICTYDIIFGEGISTGGALMDVCVDLGIITRSGANYTNSATGERIGYGKDAVKEVLSNDHELAAELTRLVYATLEARRTGAVPIETENPDVAALVQANTAEGDDEFDDTDVDGALPDGFDAELDQAAA